MSTRTLTERHGRPLLTREGSELLAAQVADLRERRIPELVPLLVEVERDERHVAEYEALLEQAEKWDRFLAAAEVYSVDAQAFDGRITLGMRVQVRLVDGSRAWVLPVHPGEAALDDERISADSPLGSALLAAIVGDEVAVHAPLGVWTCKILAVDLGNGTLVRKAPKAPKAPKTSPAGLPAPAAKAPPTPRARRRSA